MTQKTGWKPIPLSLKILFVLFVFWAIMSTMRLSQVSSMGLPLFGVINTGVLAIITVLLLDIIGPMVFLYALWNRLSWGPAVAYTYNGIFILNSVFALIFLLTELGFVQIIIPTIASVVFVYLIWRQRDYFTK